MWDTMFTVGQRPDGATPHTIQINGRGQVSGHLRIMEKKLLLSLFDWSGNWPLYFGASGDYRVIQIDIKHGQDILKWNPSPVERRETVGILAAPPCTHFTVSGSQYWAAKDMDGRTAENLRLVMRVLDVVDMCPNLRFWMMENPVGRLPQWIGRPERIEGRYTFDPCDYAGYALDPAEDQYTKKTCMWGKFRLPPKRRLEPVMHTTADGKRGSWMWAKLGGKSEKTKELRATTPLGFSKACWIGNRGY